MLLFKPPVQYTLFKQRRARLLAAVRAQNQGVTKGIILVAAGFETERYGFRQESSFYYLTGITEPAAILALNFDGTEIMYLPRFNQARDQWVNVCIAVGEDPKKFEIDQIRYLGEWVTGYAFRPVFTQEKYAQLVSDLQSGAETLFIPCDPYNEGYMQGNQLYIKLQEWLGASGARVLTHDISLVLHQLRRIKDEYEIGLLRGAAQITNFAHEAAANVIAPGKGEYEVQAAIEYVFTHVAGTRPSFPSIVATGKNTTVLHYTDRNQLLQDGDLVVVDIGAEYGSYAADLTRTYPVNGKFTPRQKEIYTAVLQTQLYVESIAQPGMYLKNPAHPDMSLHHLAVGFLEKLGFAKYFCHGIGHYLGLDVHDVGDYATPLAVGDVFTIEPGIYIAEEKLGVRIEDDYVMSEDGALCLSFDLPKTPEEIEAMMAQAR